MSELINGPDLYKDEQYEDLTEAELAEQIDDELDGAEDKPEKNLPQWAVDKTVTVYGREFVIEPPTIGVTLRIINVFGVLAVRGERVALRALSSLAAGSKNGITVSTRVAIFGMLAALNVADVHSLGSAVLQFPDDRKGRAFLHDAPEGQSVPLSPLVRALFLNLSQSTDLRDSLADFFDGLGMMEGLLDGLSLGL